MNEYKAASPGQVDGGDPTTAPAATGLAGDVDSSLYADVSREMVHLYKEQFGRGPTKAKTAFAGPDCLVCTLEDSFTPAERRLAEMGEHQRLRDVRLFFQHATEAQFREVVERLTRRKVRAFVSGLDTAKDVSSEVFYLVPASGSESS
jgi:uncharacterized protein YbcI